MMITLRDAAWQLSRENGIDMRPAALRRWCLANGCRVAKTRARITRELDVDAISEATMEVIRQAFAPPKSHRESRLS